jgi:hypothetical protein
MARSGSKRCSSPHRLRTTRSTNGSDASSTADRPGPCSPHGRRRLLDPQRRTPPRQQSRQQAWKAKKRKGAALARKKRRPRSPRPVRLRQSGRPVSDAGDVTAGNAAPAPIWVGRSTKHCLWPTTSVAFTGTMMKSEVVVWKCVGFRFRGRGFPSDRALGVGFRPAPAPGDFRQRPSAPRAAAAGDAERPALAPVKHSTEWHSERAISVELCKGKVMAGAIGTGVKI